MSTSTYYHFTVKAWKDLWVLRRTSSVLYSIQIGNTISILFIEYKHLLTKYVFVMLCIYETILNYGNSLRIIDFLNRRKGIPSKLREHSRARGPCFYSMIYIFINAHTYTMINSVKPVLISRKTRTIADHFLTSYSLLVFIASSRRPECHMSESTC